MHRHHQGEPQFIDSGKNRGFEWSAVLDMHQIRLNSLDRVGEVRSKLGIEAVEVSAPLKRIAGPVIVVLVSSLQWQAEVLSRGVEAVEPVLCTSTAYFGCELR